MYPHGRWKAFERQNLELQEQHQLPPTSPQHASCPVQDMGIPKRLHLLLHSLQLKVHVLLLFRVASRRSLHLLPQLLVADFQG